MVVKYTLIKKCIELELYEWVILKKKLYNL